MTGGPVEIIRFAGELDISRRDELRGMLLATPPPSAVLLDLADVTYADSTALAELLRFCMTMKEADRPVALLVATPQFERVIQYAGLDQAFAVFRDREAARDYLGAGA